MIALSDPAAALLSFAIVAVVVAAVMVTCDRYSSDRDEPVPGQDIASHVTVIPARRDWGSEVQAAHRQHVELYDQDKGAA